MDIIRAAKVYEEELRKEEFECIQNIIESYKNPYRLELMNLTGEIFTFDSYDIGNMFCDRYYIVTFVTKKKIYYKQ